jgi:hypothetical protein
MKFYFGGRAKVKVRSIMRKKVELRSRNEMLTWEEERRNRK